MLPVQEIYNSNTKDIGKTTKLLIPASLVEKSLKISLQPQLQQTTMSSHNKKTFKNLASSLIKLSELSIFHINDIIINLSDDITCPNLIALDYTQVVNKANSKPRKGKLPKIFNIIRECALDCIHAAN